MMHPVLYIVQLPNEEGNTTHVQYRKAMTYCRTPIQVYIGKSTRRNIIHINRGYQYQHTIFTLMLLTKYLYHEPKCLLALQYKVKYSGK